MLSPGEPYPGRECLFRPDHICVLTGVLYSWLKCQLSGYVLHVFDVICSRLKANSQEILSMRDCM